MYWTHPPKIKVYEALGSVADGRIKISGNSAEIYSSSGNKFYTVNYDPAAQAIMVNDNGSYYKGYLGYPAIAFLLITGVLMYSPKAAQMLKGVAWKDINVRFKNDFDRTLQFILSKKSQEEVRELEGEVEQIDNQLKELKFKVLGKRVKPPEGY